MRPRRSPAISRLCLISLLLIIGVRDVTTQEQDLFFPYGTAEGDVELPIEDDTGIEFEISTSYFPFFDQNHRSVYVNTNGVISFLENVEQYTPESFPLGNNRRMIAPYWADVDVTNGGHVWYRQSVDPVLLQRATDEVARVFAVDFRFNPFKAEWLLIATWDKVAFYNSRSSQFSTNVPKENTFQAVLVTDTVYSFTLFNYGEIQWTTGSASFGDKLTGLAGDNERAVPAQVGFNAGDGLNFYSVPNSQTDEILHINRTTNVRKPGRWMFRIDGKEIEAAGCQNDMEGNLRISPSQVIMLGGDVLSISGPCFDTNSDVFCRIQDYKIQASYDFTDDPFTVRCATPLFVALGESPVYLSKDGGQNYNYTGYITVVGMDRAAPRVESAEENDVLRVTWETDGYPFTNSLAQDDVRVDVFLYSYTEDPATAEIWLKPVLKIVDNLKLSNGFDSLIKPQLPESIDVGIYRVVEHGTVDISQPGISVIMGVSGKDPSQTPIPSMWSMPFNANPDDADSDRWCRAWSATEPRLDVSGDNLPSCPCTLQQARADVGSFEPYPWCNQAGAGNDKCPYRTDAVHCVRARKGSDQGRGQLCCYDKTDNIVLLEDSYEGGSAQSHFNGGHTPAGYPGNVPYLSNFLGDRVPWEQCCPRTNYNPSSCDLYRERRPSSDCKNYLPPKPAAVFGEPHFITFDGTKYIFNGYGEFTLVSAPGEDLTMQGRMAQIMNNVQATGLTVVTMKVSDSDTIQVELNDRRTLDVWVRRAREARGTWQRLGFEQSNWWTARPRGAIVELIGAEESQGVRVIFSQGTAFEAKAPAGASAMAVQILAAPLLRDGTTGLLGEWNGDPSDDLKDPNGVLFSADSLTKLHEFFGVKWFVAPNSSLFRYDISVNVSTINLPGFQAVYDLDSTLTEEQLNTVCGDSQVCRYDYQKTSSPEMGTGARDTEEDYEGTSEDTTPVDSCGYLKPPQGGSKNGRVYLEGFTVTFTCADGYEMMGSASRQCVQRVWQGNDTVCTSPKTSMRDLFLIIIIAAVLGGILLLALCFLCVVCCFRRKRRAAKERDADHELGTISGGEGFHNGALVTTPLANDRTPSSNSSIIDDPNYEYSLQRNNHHHGTAFPFPGPGGDYPRRPPRDHQLANPVEGPGYRGSAITSRGPGYRSAEEAVAGPSHAGSSTASARPIPRDPSLSKQPKTRAHENPYDDPLEVRQKTEKAKNMKGSFIKDPNASQYDSDDSSDDEIARIKRQIRLEVEQEEDDDAY